VLEGKCCLSARRRKEFRCVRAAAAAATSISPEIASLTKSRHKKKKTGRRHTRAAMKKSLQNERTRDAGDDSCMARARAPPPSRLSLPPKLRPGLIETSIRRPRVPRRKEIKFSSRPLPLSHSPSPSLSLSPSLPLSLSLSRSLSLCA